MDIAIGTVRVEDGRSTGQRFVHHQVLEKTIRLMSDLGEKEAALAVSRWRDGPGKVPGLTALNLALKNANRHHQTFLEKGMWREAACCELAAFCVQSCLDEAT